MRSLPMDLLLSILSFLPLIKLYQLRLVSKAWNSVLTSRELWHLWSSHQSLAHQSSSEQDRSPWLLMARRDKKTEASQDFCVYICSNNTTTSTGMHTPQEAWLPPNSIKPPFYPGKWFSFHHLANDGHYNFHNTLMCAAGNLMCFLDADARDNDYYKLSAAKRLGGGLTLVDISTRDVWWVDLPLDFVGQKWDTILKLVHTDRNTSRDDTIIDGGAPSSSSSGNGYHIILMSSFYCCVDVYDTRTKVWSKGRPIREAKDVDVPTIRKADVFHVDVASPKCGYVFGYHVELDAWSKITLNPLPQLAHDSHVFVTKYKDRLLLASALMVSTNIKQGLRGHHHRREIGFGVWELLSRSLISSDMPLPHESSSSLSSASSYDHPLSLSTNLASNGSTLAQVSILEAPHLFSMENTSLESSSNKSPNKSYNFKFMASENIICMTGVLHGKDDKCMSPIIYDISTNSWHQTPSYHDRSDFFGIYHDRSDFFGICAFTPKFQTLASL